MLLLVFFLLGSSTIGPNPQVELGFMEFCVWCPSLPLVRSADSRVHGWLCAADSRGHGDGPRPAYQDDPGERPGDREPSPALWRRAAGEGGYCETLSGGAWQKQKQAQLRPRLCCPFTCGCGQVFSPPGLCFLICAKGLAR